MGCRLYSGGFLSLWGEVGKCDLSVTNSAYVVTGKDCSSLRGTWLYPIFIFVLYDCSFGESQILLPWLVYVGIFCPCLVPWWRVRFLAVPFCVRGMWFGSECVPWLKRQPGGWLFSLVMELIFFGLLSSSSPLSVRIPHPVLMPNYWVRYSV